jgi:hypothetical protein
VKQLRTTVARALVVLAVAAAMTTPPVRATAHVATRDAAAVSSNTGVMSQGAPAAGHDYVNHVTGGTAILWRDLEPADQSFTGPAWAQVDALMANPAVDGIRLRLLAGRHSPDFVKRMGGPGVSGQGYDCSVSGGIAVHNPYDDTGGCVPRFWERAVLDQYEQVLREVARRYGDNPKLSEVVSSACMTTYAEPFYRAHSDGSSNRRLWEAGLDRAADVACQDRSMTITSTVFPTRPTSLAVNPWEIVVAPGAAPAGRQLDWAATHEFVTRWTAVLGDRLVLQNNGWGENEGCPAGETPATNVYCYLASADGPTGYQSETWERLGDSIGGDSLTGWYRSLDRAVAAGACFVESTDNAYRRADPARMAEYDRRLEANC